MPDEARFVVFVAAAFLFFVALLCLIAGIRLARATTVNHRVIPTSNSIDESVDLAHEIYNRVFRKVPERIAQK